VTREVPEHLGELSTWALQEAIDKVDNALADAPDEIRAAVSVIRLVTNMPRQAPWYGVSIDREDSSVTVGVMMRNAFEALGDWVDALGSGGRIVTKTDHWFTRLYAETWRRGKREYNDYLDHLLDPVQWENKRQISAERAAAHRAAMERYRTFTE
jgi:hypothetical protein